MNIQTPPGPAEIEAILGLDAGSRRKAWRRRLMWLGLLALAIGGIAWWVMTSPSGGKAVTYDTAPVETKPIIVRVQATGNIQPTTEVEVSSERSGVIRNVNVKANSVVKKGDVLAELDTERLQAERARGKAAVAATEARLADARATLLEKQLLFNRAEKLSSRGVSSTQDVDTARAAQSRAEAGVVAAEADIAVAKADMAMTETDLTKTRILSPVDGIVLKRTAEPGQTVASSFQAPVLFTLAEDLARMQLEADVDEADIGAVKEGQTASFTVDAYPGKSFPAVIDTIEYSPEVTENVVTYKAVLTVDNRELLLRPGMTVCVDVSFFGHPDFNGVRIETGYEITTGGPVPMSTMVTTRLFNRSADVRPMSTAARDIGSERNRSMMPRCRSSARPTLVLAEPNATVCVNTPAMRNSR